MYRLDKSSLVSTRKDTESRLQFIQNITARSITHPTFKKVIAELAHDSLLELNQSLPGFSHFFSKAFPNDVAWDEIPCFNYNKFSHESLYCTDNFIHNMPPFIKCRERCIHICALCFDIGVGRRHKVINCSILALLDELDQPNKPFLRDDHKKSLNLFVDTLSEEQGI